MPTVLQDCRPSLVLTRISAFGQTGPYRDREATGIVLQAMGGPMNATGQADREPLRKPGYLEHYTIGRSAAAATMAGLFHARRTGTGSVIDVSGQEVLLGGADRRASYLLSAAYSGMTAPRGARSPHRFGATFSGPMATRDGHVMIYVTNQAFWDRMARMIGEEFPEFAEEFVGKKVIMGEDRERFLATCARWFGARDKIAVMEEAERNRIPITAIMSVREVFEHPHFRGRGAFAAIDHPVAGRLEYSGAPFRMARGYALRRPAPLLDQHRDEILARARARRRRRRGRGHDRRGPNTLARWTGSGWSTSPWCGRVPARTALLGDLGAEVIRVEGNDRISRQVSAKVTKESIAAAGYHGGTYPGQGSGRPAVRPDRAVQLARPQQTRGLHESGHPRGPRGPCSICSPCRTCWWRTTVQGCWRSSGSGHELLPELFPRLVIARMPPLGLTGEMSNYLGYGPNFNSLVGIAAHGRVHRARVRRAPGENYHMDEAAPAGLAFAVLVALWDRETTGRGAVIEFSQAENVMAEIGEYLVDLQRSGQTPAVLGNTDHQLFQDVCRDQRPVAFRGGLGAGAGLAGARPPAPPVGLVTVARTEGAGPAPRGAARLVGGAHPGGRGEHSAGGPDPGRRGDERAATAGRRTPGRAATGSGSAATRRSARIDIPAISGRPTVSTWSSAGAHRVRPGQRVRVPHGARL